MKYLNLFLICVSFLVTPVFASSQFPSFFIQVKGGHQWASDNTYSHSNPNDSIWGVYGGLQFTPDWSWDVGYQYHDNLNADITSVNIKTRLIESAFRYDWYLEENLSLYGRLGVAYWDMEKNSISSDKLEATGFSPIGELGVNYNFTPSFRLSAGYQYIDSLGESHTGKYDSHGFLIGLAYSFGGGTKTDLVNGTSNPLVEKASDPVAEIVDVEPLPNIQIFPLKRINGLFDFDSVKIGDDFFEQLSELALVLNIYPQARVIITGHTDATGTSLYNQTLSEKRAQVVVNQLIELGVSPSQVDWSGEGEFRPIVDNTSKEGRAKNRRVDITIPSFQF